MREELRFAWMATGEPFVMIYGMSPMQLLSVATSAIQLMVRSV